MVTQDKFKETDHNIRRTFQAVADDLHLKSTRIEKKVNACADDEVQAILTKLVDLKEQVEKVGELLNGQDTNMQEELQAAERRWERQLNQQEARLEGRLEEQEMCFQDGQKETAYKMQTVAVRVDDALEKLNEDTRKAPWERQLQEAAVRWRKELQDTLADRPMTGQLSAYMTLETTENKLRIEQDSLYY